MVPCQPRQLVIFSLPFAALVAFFWFKRRRSLSRSDPGGTLDQTKLVDKPATGSVTGESAALKVDNSCVKGIEVACSQTPVLKAHPYIPIDAEPVKETENEITKSVINSINAFDDKIINNCTIKKKELINSTPVEEKENIVCNGLTVFNLEVGDSCKEREEELDTLNCDLDPTFEVFHSTVIEDNDSNKTDLLCSFVEDKLCEELVEKVDSSKVEDKIEADNNICVKKEDLDIDITLTNIILKEEKPNTVECITLEKEYFEKLVNTIDKSILTVDQNNHSETSDIDSVGNISTDTGVGSLDMAQGQSAEKPQNNEMGLEQKLASLGLDTQQAAAAQRAERDSANHSPAEVMLNSPAISTFSDAHSEGSSDSGKGCSDVVTPPSRTPAGGSSVAGDQVPSIYEFVLPQVIVGRLIGRHGAFLQDIRTKTHTNVFIKRHPETNSLKICAIEGTQPDIDSALKMIRQKFPLRRFPDLTLERVSFVKNSSLPINPENLHLHLVEGVNNDVVVSYMFRAGHLFLQLPMHMSYQNLYRMACIMNTVYSTEETPTLPDPQPDVVCVVPAAGGWYRAQILSVDEEAHTSDVRFLDYGGFLTVKNSELRQIRGDFLLLPFQAIECFLANVVPAGGEEEWSEAANLFVQSITTQQILQAQVYDYADNGLPMVYLYFTQFYQSASDPSGLESRVVLLNQELVSHGFAELIEGAVEDEEQKPSADTS